MNDKEIGEIRRHLRRDRSNITAIYGCYVNDNKEVISEFRQSTGIMPENESDKYFALLRRSLSGAIGKNLIDITFKTSQVAGSPEHKMLMDLRETNADTVSWYMESVWITVGRDGILSFEWDAPSTEPVVKETQTALMPFEDIASIANTMLPVVIIGPSEARSLVEIDKINGDETYMDVEITKVSLSLMRIRDKGSLQGTIVPVWDFWGTWDWYEPGDNASESMKKGATYVTQPMLTLNAIDGNVVSRMFGY